MKRVVCEHCGSQDLVENDGQFVCQSCGSIYKPEETGENPREEIAQEKRTPSPYGEKVYTIKKEYDERTFFREVLVKLSLISAHTPPDILSARFGTVSEVTKEILVLKCDVCVFFSGLMGHNHQETHSVEEYDHWLGKVVTREKTITITEWEPFSGSRMEKSNSIGLNGGEERVKGFTELFTDAYKGVKDESVAEEGSAWISPEALSKLKKECADKVPLYWPGHHKNDSYDTEAEIASLSCFIIPCYAMNYTYKGKTYRAMGMAFGRPNAVFEVPEMESIDSIRKRGETEYANQMKIPETFYSLSWIAMVGGAIMAVIGLYIGGLINNWVLMIIGIILLVAGIVTRIVSSQRIKGIPTQVEAATDREVRNTHFNYDAKRKRLIEVLAANNLPPLTDFERDLLTPLDRN